ncbi:phosphoprotein [Orgi virus]|uniref:Phosphoprotein n=1 Tax=Orgi virus TaxID=1911434 RepID=A0A2Z2CF53_9RHAB|nr:phosphoprotein [Orgi virus]AOX47521.1 phosphoprotein [Orgi virus]AOX47525.1 phosphoprotein [Orgi virus]
MRRVKESTIEAAKYFDSKGFGENIIREGELLDEIQGGSSYEDIKDLPNVSTESKFELSWRETDDPMITPDDDESASETSDDDDLENLDEGEAIAESLSGKGKEKAIRLHQALSSTDEDSGCHLLDLTFVKNPHIRRRICDEVKRSYKWATTGEAFTISICPNQGGLISLHKQKVRTINENSPQPGPSRTVPETPMEIEPEVYPNIMKRLRKGVYFVGKFDKTRKTRIFNTRIRGMSEAEVARSLNTLETPTVEGVIIEHLKSTNAYTLTRNLFDLTEAIDV